MSQDENNKSSGVKFEIDDWQAVKYYREPTAPKIIRLMMKYSGGLIKEEKQAEYVFLGFIVLAIILTIFLPFVVVSKKNTLPPQEIIDGALRKQQYDI